MHNRVVERPAVQNVRKRGVQSVCANVLQSVS